MSVEEGLPEGIVHAFRLCVPETAGVHSWLPMDR